MSMLSLIPWMIIFAFFASLRGFFLADVYCVICFSPRRQGRKVDDWWLIIDCWWLIAIYPRMTRITRMSAGGRGLLLMIDCWCFLSMDYTDDTDSQDMGCAQIKSVESVESVGHEGCWGTLKPTDYTDYTDVRRRTGIIVDDWWLIIDDWLLIADVVYPRIIRMSRMSAGGRGLLLMTDCWLLFIHGWHGYHGCPQADGGLGIGMCRTGVVLGEWICEECVFLRLWCGAWLGTRLFLPSSLWVAVGWGVRITNLILQL